jgi:hypothetical protein
MKMRTIKSFPFVIAALMCWVGSALGADLPPAGVDRFNAIVEMTVQARLGPDPSPFRLILVGPVVVQRGTPQQLRGGSTITTEILSMDLAGPEQLVGPNQDRAKVSLTLAPRLRSVGQIQTSGRTFEGATSYFDLFFQLQIGDQILTNNDPIRLQATINAFPPIDTAYLPNTQPAGLTASPFSALPDSTDALSVSLNGGGLLSDIQFSPAPPSSASVLKQASDFQKYFFDFSKGVWPCPLCPLFGSTIKVSGKVTNKNGGAPLQGWTVQAGGLPDPINGILSPTSQAVTKADGSYSFTVPKGSTGIVFPTPPGTCGAQSSPLTTFNADVVYNFQLCP